MLSFYFSRIILYAIAMADYDQENNRVCKDVLKTKDGLDRLILYHSSVGRLFLLPFCSRVSSFSDLSAPSHRNRSFDV